MENLKEMSIHSTTSLTASENGEHTYAFTKDFEELNGKRGVLILLYPTRTEENYHVEDSTTIHIMKHMKQLGLKSYTIVNLFSHVVRKRLSTRGLTIDEKNLQFIKTEIFEKYDSEKDIVIIAWGNSHETSQAVNDAKKKVLEMWSELYPSETFYVLIGKVSSKDLRIVGKRICHYYGTGQLCKTYGNSTQLFHCIKTVQANAKR